MARLYCSAEGRVLAVAAGLWWAAAFAPPALNCGRVTPQLRPGYL